MLATAHATVLQGIQAQPVRVEVESFRGPPEFLLVGLPEASVRESKVRVRSALYQLGVNLGEYFVVVNLAPADVRKAGGAFDLAIAAATLAAVGHLSPDKLARTLMLGELSLTGAVRPVRGVLPQLLSAKASGTCCAIVPSGNEQEAGSVDGLEVLVADSLEEVRNHLSGKSQLSTARRTPFEPCCQAGLDLSDVKGQESARRALEIAAAGGHHLLMIGAPGGGKTMLARRMPSILPPLDYEEAIDVTTIHSVAGMLPPDCGFVRSRPFRAPHHTVSDAGLVGGGDPPRPGEISLAHLGVLFLDELAEFRRSSLEALRQPLEDGVLTIARARTRATFPARPQVIAAVNPCPCGYAGDNSGRCQCGEHRIRAYRAKLSGPLVDRLDLHVHVPPVEIGALRGLRVGERSCDVRARVVRAREIQQQRAADGDTTLASNARLSPSDLERVATPEEAGHQLLLQAVEQLGLSARAFTKVLRVARTIADLEGSDAVLAVHVAEAIHGRVLDRTLSPAS
ncbi:MAG: YifB family Mg chelatase-like AAA ATPase [Polyangiaceae bacterium]|jgi:magnesium chelatase family protein|nr:YifB family Mg chelatase-like AAA ATPase [Polyangiaceae bacterium]